MVDEIWLPQIDKGLCTSCGDCIVICPTDALALVGNAAVVAEPTACNYCGECEIICPVDAIALPYQIILEADQ